MVDFEKLTRPFPKEAISWRAQSVTQDGKKAMALAYIDARDVMNRLDEVCSPAGWQCKYSHANGKTVCDIGILCNVIFIIEGRKTEGEWVWKADGAGDSDIEAEKGALSDAFKRAAVRWGIGRYLYNLDAPWVPCETREYNGKKQFVKFTEDPWAYVKTPNQTTAIYGTNGAMKDKYTEIVAAIEHAETHEQLKAIWKENNPHILTMKKLDETFYNDLIKTKENQKKIITDALAQLAAFGPDFNKAGVA